MQIDQTPIATILPYINNAKVHSDSQVDMIAASITEFGFNNPVLIDENNTIIAGHGRLLAAKKAGLDTIPTIQLEHLTDAQKKAYILADNRLGEVGTEWDVTLVQNELAFLEEHDFDFELTGFDDDWLPVDSVGFPELNDGEKGEIQTKSFTLHDDQLEVVLDAVERAKLLPEIDTGINDNQNGNAITYICEQWINGIS